MYPSPEITILFTGSLTNLSVLRCPWAMLATLWMAKYKPWPHRMKMVISTIIIIPKKNKYCEDEDVLKATWHSTTPPIKPLSHDRLYYFLPVWDDKPSLYIRALQPDHRRRMYAANALSKIADKLVRKGDIQG